MERQSQNSTIRPPRARRRPALRDQTLARLEAQARRPVQPKPEPDDPQARLRAVEQKLMMVGSTRSAQLRRWTCPAHREGWTLSVRLEAEGFVRLECERGWGTRPGCDLGQVLDAIGIDAFDLAPRRYRHDA